MKKYIVLGGLVLVPSIVFAATATSVLEKVKSLISIAVPLVIALAVLFFLFALVQYMTKVGEERDTARNHMIWGIIILFVMVSLWGLVNLVQDTFGINQGSQITNPINQINF